MTTTDPIVRCRYLRRNDQQCTGEAADPEGEVMLCIKHSSRVFAATWHRMVAAGIDPKSSTFLAGLLKAQNPDA